MPRKMQDLAPRQKLVLRWGVGLGCLGVDVGGKIPLGLKKELFFF